MNDVKKDVKKFLTLEDANVTLGIMCTIGPTRFTGLLAEFRARYPGVTLKLVEGIPERLSEQLEAGDALDSKFRAMASDEIDRFRREIIQRTGGVTFALPKTSVIKISSAK